MPEPKTLKAIANALGVRPDLFTGRAERALERDRQERTIRQASDEEIEETVFLGGYRIELYADGSLRVYPERM